jgi:hypothetical protein
MEYEHPSLKGRYDKRIDQAHAQRTGGTFLGS